MILPNKHVSIKRSLLGQSGLVLRHLKRPKTLSTLWEQVKTTGEVRSFNRFLLALDLLYMIGAVELDRGLIRRVKE